MLIEAQAQRSSGRKHNDNRASSTAFIAPLTFKIHHRTLPVLVDRDLDPDCLPAVELVLERARLEAANGAANLSFGVGNDVIHVRRDGGPGVLRDQAQELLDALFVRGDLGLDVREVLGKGRRKALD